MRVIVLGYIVRCPLGGMTWHYLNYVLGFHGMGHDVVYIEDSEDYPCCYDPERHVTDTDPSYGLRYTDAIFQRIGLEEKWAYYDAHSWQWLGPLGSTAEEMCRGADIVLNVSGTAPARPWLSRIPVHVFVDTDPLFEQIRQNTVPIRRERAMASTHRATFGENISSGQSTVPVDGWDWLATRQPVAMDFWPFAPPSAGRKYTTIMQWDSYPTREYDGVRFGMKSASFEPYFDLPSRVNVCMELSLGSGGAPRDQLREEGWTVENPLSVTKDPWTYQDYIHASRGEWTVAKDGYVKAGTGWFSERSACYLASGRPVVTQDTGFGRHIPTGLGLFAFSDPDGAVSAIETIESDYDRHSRAAREIAEEYFSADVVLTDLLRKVGI